MSTPDSPAAQAGREAARELVARGLVPPPAFYRLLSLMARRHRQHPTPQVEERRADH